MYKLVNGEYQLLAGNPIWLPEVGLGIGMERGTYQNIPREWLYWYNEQGKRLLTPEERAAKLADKLRDARYRP